MSVRTMSWVVAASSWYFRSRVTGSAASMIASMAHRWRAMRS
jgi:hypothetical protein